MYTLNVAYQLYNVDYLKCFATVSCDVRCNGRDDDDYDDGWWQWWYKDNDDKEEWDTNLLIIIIMSYMSNSEHKPIYIIDDITVMKVRKSSL